jgi:2-polyprenyl-3-methyl-5-hydroxy-6-metoxy-1,4-benzoquinol methylase
MSSPAVTAAAESARLHADGVAAFEAGDLTTAADLLAQAARESFDPTVLNDLAVVQLALGDADRARALLTTCLTIDPEDEDALANVAALDDQRSWRESQTLGGDDLRVPERAYPGMALTATMSEHAMRYSMALNVLPGMHFIDVGCGTGYGSEMLTWRGGTVRGFDLWEPAPHEVPRWSGGAELTYGFDVCKNELPAADAAVMFEVLEHLGDGPAALRNVFNAVDTLLVSFPNPVYHGSHLNHHHVNDWTLEQVEDQLMRAAATRFAELKLAHMYQPQGFPTILPGRDPAAPFWIFLAQGVGTAPSVPAGRRLKLPR